jgi:hypothetical protein
MTIKKLLIILLVTGGIGVGSWYAWNSDAAQTWWADQQKGNLPPAENLAESIAAPAINAVANRYGNEAIENVVPPVVDETPDQPNEKNLNVPFTSQAPHANWDTDHNEFCEEAAVLMAGRFFQGRDIVSKDDAEDALQRIKDWQVENLGYYYDTTAAETAQIVEGLYGLKVELKVDPTTEDIKNALASNKLVVVPAAGRELGNPYYTPPGPIYHMLLIRGYTADDKFITNDAGTRRGEEFVYSQSVVMNAIHDWVPNQPRTEPRNGAPTGRKVALIIGPK